MQKGIRRGFCCLLCVLLLLPAFFSLGSLRAAAASDEKRFIFSSLQSAGGTVYPATVTAPVELALSETDQSFVADSVTTVATDGSTNALYISLINNSNATVLEVSYHYMDTEPRSHTFRQDLNPSSATRQSFVLPNPDICKSASELTLRFSASGQPAGSVILESFFDVSVYEEEPWTESTPENCFATLENCAYVADTGAVEIAGELSFNAAARYENLALFALGPGEDLYLSSKTPVARMGVSFRFTFSVAVESADEIFARYVVAGITKDGKREPLCSPIYPDVAANGTPATPGFKGYYAGSVYDTVDAGTEMGIVDVYLDRLPGDQNNGILYAGDHSYYYFDESYVNELDHLVRNLSGAGCNVYLRFLVSATANGLPFVTYTEDASGIVNKGVAVTNEEALLHVHAITDFLTARYTGSNGELSGIILGRRADRAAVYGYVGNMGLSDYAKLYATALALISGAAKVNVPALRVVVPISDRMWPDTMTPANLTGDYLPELFLLSLLEALNSCTHTTPALSVMVESDSIPDRLCTQTGTTYGTDRLASLLTVIEQYAGYYAFLDKSILYAWTPDETLSEAKLTAAYAMQYIGLALNERVHSFVLDFSTAQGPSAAAARLHHLVTQIDTQNSSNVLSAVLPTLGVSAFTELYPAYTPAALQSRQLLLQALSEQGYANGKTPLGSHEMWNFSDATGVMSWYAGQSCGELSVLARALTARLTPINGGFSDMAYHFEGTDDLSFAPLMRFSVGIDGAAGAPYEVQVRLIGVGADVIASAVLTSGGTHELYLDLEDHAALLSQLECIRVLARPLNGSAEPFTLRLHTVVLESTTLTTGELADRIAADDGVAEEEQAEENRDYTRPILITVLIIGVSVAIAAILIIRTRHHDRPAHAERAQAAKEEERDEKKEKKCEGEKKKETSPEDVQKKEDQKKGKQGS